jgi:hypothetical protein
MQLLNISRWPSVLIFLVAGLMVVISAFASVNLFHETMANLAFIRRYGLLAIKLGALWQLGKLLVSGVLALSGFLVFKLCEVELVNRYRAWAAGNKGRDRTGRDRH